MRMLFTPLVFLGVISCVPAEDVSVVKSAESEYKAPQPDVYAFVHAHDDHWHSHHTRENHRHPDHQWDVLEEVTVGEAAVEEPTVENL
ncbi:hypothetical protein [Rubritalea sp.]|uniref:hypothetical protein n=1 Tax=Rubritalea sp. TaxID=2109375 RepID=UPI003EF59B2E